jgi:hypothetical protein
MPVNGDEGYVDRAVVIQVLRAHGVDASLIQVEGQPDMMLLVKGDVILSQTMPPALARKKVHYLARTFTIPVHHFYNPLMAPPMPGEKLN